MSTQRTKVSFNTRVFDPENYPDTAAPIYSHGTTCCALTIMSAQNYHSAKEIQKAIEEIKKHSLSRKFSPVEREFGERNIMVITTPSEIVLEKNLLKVGFKQLTEGLPRRNGYPAGTLKMFLYSF